MTAGALSGLLIAAAVTAHANPLDDMPVEVSAQHSDYDLRTGTATLSGEIIITRGPTRISAERGRVSMDGGEIRDAELEGDPCHWQDRLEDGTEINGWARRMEYDAATNRIRLVGDARIRHAQGEVSGDTLTYDMTTESLTGTSDGEGRVRWIIDPEALPRTDGDE